MYEFLSRKQTRLFDGIDPIKLRYRDIDRLIDEVLLLTRLRWKLMIVAWCLVLD